MPVSSEEHLLVPGARGAVAAYLAWRDDVEAEFLNEFSAAGFELVALHREVIRQSETPRHVHFYLVPRIFVRAYFKRPAAPDLPDAPSRRIGFVSRETGAT